jgi:putative transposase
MASATEEPTIWQVDDGLWALLAPLLRIEKVRQKPGRPRVDDRTLFDGLIWLARTGSQWAALPRCFGSKSTLHRRFWEWIEAGALQRAWAEVLLSYDAEIGLDRLWLVADSSLHKAPLGAQKGGVPTPRRPVPTRPIGAKVAPNGTC